MHCPLLAIYCGTTQAYEYQIPAVRRQNTKEKDLYYGPENDDNRTEEGKERERELSGSI